MIESTPQVSREGNHIVVCWRGFNADFSHFQDLKGATYGGLNCEAHWTTTLPGTQPHLHEARLNLSSTNARENVEKAIRRRLESDSDLARTIADFVEAACVMAIRCYRQGMPLINLADVTFQPAPFAVGEIFPYHKRAQVYAPAEHFKTTLMLAFMMDVQTGDKTLGFDVMQSGVALLDWETDDNDASNLWQRLALGRGLTRAPDIWYQRLHRPLWEEAEALEPQFRRNGIGFCTIDSAFWASGTNPLDQAAVGQMFQGIDALGDITSVFLNHTASSQRDEKRRRAYGLEHFKNAVRASWELRKADPMPGDSTINLGLYRDKLNMRAPAGPFGFRVRFEGGDDGPIYIERNDRGLDDVPELEESKPDKERVRDYLSHNGMSSTKQLSEGLRIPNANVWTAVSRLKGQVGKTEREKTTFYYVLDTTTREDWSKDKVRQLYD